MDCESRRELALKELETYYGTIGSYLDDLKHEIEDMQLFEQSKRNKKGTKEKC